MSYKYSLKQLFNKVIIPNSLNNKMILEYENNKTLPNQNKRPFSSFNINESSLAEKKMHKNIKYRNFSNNLKRKKNKIIQYNSLKKGDIFNLQYNLESGQSMNTTQTQKMEQKSKKPKHILVNSFRNKYPSIDLKKSHLGKNKKFLYSYTYKNNDHIHLDNINNRNNNICIGANLNKTINNVIVDNNMDFLREYKFQTVNNFNNKYKLKFKATVPKMQNKISNVFSLLKKYKYEEEKKIDTIKTLVNEKPKKIKKTKKNIEIFNEKDFNKNFSLIEKDFDIKNKLIDNKKFVFIHTLNLLKKENKL